MSESKASGLPRQMTSARWSFLVSMWAIAPLVQAPLLIDLFANSYAWPRQVFCVAVVAVVCAQRVPLVRRALDEEPTARPPVQMLVTAALSVAMYLVMTPVTDFGGYWVATPAVVLGLLATLVRDPLRKATIYFGPAVLIVPGAVLHQASGAPDSIGQFLLISVLIGYLFTATDLWSVWLWKMVIELDRARSTAATLAVTEERLRIAADLHDIQGNHLQAIALKGELAERLVGTDEHAARAQAAEIAELARRALSDTRALVQGYRKTDLDTEISNAVGILDAAGITVSVHGDAERVPATLRPLFGALFREGTTNLLRHSNASTARLSIVVDQDRVTASLRNDGVAPRAANSADGSGLAGLRERFVAVGGRVEVAVRDGSFELTASAEGGRR